MCRRDIKSIENRQMLTLVGILGIFFVSYHGTVNYTKSDPLGSLLTSQAMIEHKTVKLDSYTGNISVSYVGKLEKLPMGHGKFRNHNGHAYHAFPIGTAIYSIPFVWLARLQGKDMLDPASDEALQRLLSSLSCALAFLLVLAIARHFLPFYPSYLFSLIMVLSSPLISTMGSALWSSVYAVIFSLTALLLLIRARLNGTHPNAWLLAPVLFSAYLCRPTLGVLLVFAAGYTFFVHRSVAMKVAGIVMLQVLLFVAWSLLEFRQPTPPYYQWNRVAWLTREPVGITILSSFVLLFVAGRELQRRGKNRSLMFGIYCVLLLSGTAVLLSAPGLMGSRFSQGSITLRTLEAMNGNLFSPSRGLFIYCPVLVVVVLGIVANMRRVMRDPLFWLVTLWMIAHLVIVSRPFWWHGGHCYGARLFAEVIPGIIILALVAIKQISLSEWMRSRVLKTAIAATALFGVFVNSYQGLYNVQTAQWNVSPNIDDHTEYLFSWKFPQFLASPHLNAAKEAAYRMRMEETANDRHLKAIADRLPASSAISGGEFISTDCRRAVFERLDDPPMELFETPFRCGGNGVRVWFRLLPDQLQRDEATFEFDAAAVDTIRLLVSVNETRVETVTIRGPERTMYETQIPSSYLEGNLVESVQFDVVGVGLDAHDVTHVETRGDSLFWIWKFRIRDGS